MDENLVQLGYDSLGILAAVLTAAVLLAILICYDTCIRRCHHRSGGSLPDVVVGVECSVPDVVECGCCPADEIDQGLNCFWPDLLEMPKDGWGGDMFFHLGSQRHQNVLSARCFEHHRGTSFFSSRKSTPSVCQHDASSFMEEHFFFISEVNVLLTYSLDDRTTRKAGCFIA